MPSPEPVTSNAIVQVTTVLMVTANESRSLNDALTGNLGSAAAASLAGTILMIISNGLMVRSYRGSDEHSGRWIQG